MFTFILENPLFLEVLEFGIDLLAEVIIFCFTLYFKRKKATSETGHRIRPYSFLTSVLHSWRTLFGWVSI